MEIFKEDIGRLSNGDNIIPGIHEGVNFFVIVPKEVDGRGWLASDIPHEGMLEAMKRAFPELVILSDYEFLQEIYLDAITENLYSPIRR